MSTGKKADRNKLHRRTIEPARQNQFWPLFGLIVFVGLGMSASSGAEPATDDAPRPTMRLVFDEMKVLIPLSLNEAQWSDPKSRTQILESLDRLERAADTLERHGRSREAGFDELALNLARDLREVQAHYREGEFDEARFFLTGSLQNCVSCHIRLPYDRSFPLADELIDHVEIQGLDAREKAWLFVTVRRFEAALTVWEALMRDPAISPAQVDAGGVLVDYLNVVLRVRSDVPRARREMATLAKRPDLPIYLERRLDEWRSALDALQPKKFNASTKPSLDLGASLAEEAGKISEGPFGRDGLIQDLAAASQLVRWLELDRARREGVTKNATDSERRDTARAYYWLGVVEARSLDGFWVNLSEGHLEAAIRSDPQGPFAKPAYARLEETQVLGYGGASGVHLPSDVWTNLKELRELIGIE
jgi:hypothetical protein